MKRLELWTRETKVGRLDFKKRVLLTYEPAYVTQRGVGRPGASCSLLCTDQAIDATSWCRGLLPEGQHLATLAARIGVSTSNTYELLKHYGRDVAGAIEILDPLTQNPTAPEIVQYTDDDLRNEVESVANGSMPLAIHDDSELSLAGVQNKLLLVKTPMGWGRPKGGFPSTHIMKLDPQNRPGLVLAEHHSLLLAHTIGLNAAVSHLTEYSGIGCIVVDRYDRKVIGPVGTGSITERLHQEDLLQALGCDPGHQQGRVKYQASHQQPSLWHLANLIRRFGDEADLFRLLSYVAFNTVIGNGDAHARNYSLLIDDAGTVALAPLYDTVPTALWPGLKDRAALWVNDRARLSEVTRTDLILEAQRWGLDPSLAVITISTLLDAVQLAAPLIQHPSLRALVHLNVKRLLI
jgi:serine/threonine-protein kinase HipA